MKKYISGILSGIIAGLINCLFLFFASDLEVTIFISTFINWVVIGLLISSVNFKIDGILKGIVVALLLSLSSLIYTFSSNIFGGIWTIITTIMVGAFMGYIIERVQNR